MKLPEIKGLSAGIPWQEAVDNAEWYNTALNILGLPWWYNWLWDMIGKPGYVPMVWRLGANPPIGYMHDDDAWFIGNEPNNVEQGNQSPKEFAYYMAHLQAQRPNTCFGLPGVLWGDSGAEWVEAYIKHGGSKPDFWAIHVYAYNPTEWTERLDQAIDTLQRHHEAPVVVSEFGSWDPNNGRKIMDAGRRAIQSKKIQAAAHFSVKYDDWTEPDLISSDGELTELGMHFMKTEEQIFLPMIQV